MRISWVKKTLVASAVAVGLVATTPAIASAGIYRWDYYDTYATAAQCEDNGADLVRSTEAAAYRCTSEHALYLGYIW